MSTSKVALVTGAGKQRVGWHVATALAEAAVPPARLVLEVTEGVLIDNPEAAKARLEELRALGLKLALDDFGARHHFAVQLTYLAQQGDQIELGWLKIKLGAAVDQPS